MPRCPCAMCQAKRDGREKLFLWRVVREQLRRTGEWPYPHSHAAPDGQTEEQP